MILCCACTRRRRRDFSQRDSFSQARFDHDFWHEQTPHQAFTFTSHAHAVESNKSNKKYLSSSHYTLDRLPNKLHLPIARRKTKTEIQSAMATTRLRRTFAYPTDDNDSDPPDLDEEHQEQLLTTLQSQDEATSNLYRKLFLALPVLTSLAYMPALAWTSGGTETYVELLSVSVPALAAYILYFYPIRVPGNHGLRSLYVSSGRGGTPGGVKPPVRHLIVLGANLAIMLALQSGVLWWAADSEVRAVVPSGKFRRSMVYQLVGFREIIY